MKRRSRIAAILFSLAIVAWIWRAYQAGLFDASPQPPVTASTLHQAINHPVIFAENHLTGGIGAMLTVDSQTGLAKVVEVVNGSPAQKAGLRQGDIISSINGTTTTGKKLSQVVDELRGFVGREVTLTIRRAGGTNLEMTLHRTSWSGLGITYSPTPSNGPVLVPVGVPATPPASNSPTR